MTAIGTELGDEAGRNGWLFAADEAGKDGNFAVALKSTE